MRNSFWNLNICQRFYSFVNIVLYVSNFFGYIFSYFGLRKETITKQTIIDMFELLFQILLHFDVLRIYREPTSWISELFHYIFLR